MQQMGLDVLPPGAADDYEAYLNKVKDTTEHLITETEEVAAVLEGHDQNKFTSEIQEVLRKLAGQALSMADSVKEATIQFVGSLEEKNEAVGSQRQTEYLDQIRTAALNLENLEPYRDCELSGDLPFTEEDQESVMDGLEDLTEEWEEAVSNLKQEAEEFEQENIQNELSGLYLILSEKMESMINGMAESIEPVGLHLQGRSDSVRDRRRDAENQAADSFEDMMGKLKHELEDAAGAFTAIDF